MPIIKLPFPCKRAFFADVFHTNEHLSTQSTDRIFFINRVVDSLGNE